MVATRQTTVATPTFAGLTVTGAIVQTTGLLFIGPQTANLFPSDPGLPSATQLEHLIRANSPRNVLTIQNLDQSGFSAIRFAGYGGTENGAIGWGNAIVPPYANSFYLESFYPDSSSAFLPFKFITTNGSGAVVRLTINATKADFNLPVGLKSYTVAGLPSAATAGAGTVAFVTDANATTFNSTVAGGGSNKVPVFSDGTNWLIG